MAFRVVVTDRAKLDATDYARFILDASKSPAIAKRWLDGLSRVVLTLGDALQSYPLIQEAEALGPSYRSARYHSHRVVFRLDDSQETVFVVRIYHGARRNLSEFDLGNV